MLANIIADYLELPRNNIDVLMRLLAQEGCWQEAVDWNGKKYDPTRLRSRLDVIDFLQAFFQSRWFKGHDRLQLPDHAAGKQTKDFFSLFEGIGLTQPIDYPAAEEPPDVSVLLGSSELDVLSRVNFLKHDLLAGCLPKKQVIFGLGSNRPLGFSALDSEAYSQKKLLQQHQVPTEMNMVTLLTREGLDDLISRDSPVATLSYQAVNTSTFADGDRVKTAETALSLKEAMEHDLGLTAKKPLKIAVYSNQPYILRQQRDIQSVLGTDYLVVGVGAALTWSDFSRNHKSVSELLGEIARLVNLNYRPEHLKRLI